MTGKLGHSYSLDDGETMLDGVTKTVAAVVGEDVRDLPALYDVLDPDCLERLVESARCDLRVSFTYAGCDVVADGRGLVAAAPVTDGTGRSFGECTHCGSAFELDSDYPVAVRQADGDVTFFAFCDAECQAEWETRSPRAADD
ncbi:DUF7576 family protein [Halorussus sp. AFM4]|uniref:DUF7576 family protein n=1 Tax=Halorussus sp. AFM4 TaxID=3421651 RepID=UPI003EBDBA53